VFTETLRLYPPLWILTRVTTRDTHLGGQPLPRGTVIVFSPYAAGRNPDLFTNPDTFDPDRWLPDRATALPRGAFLPFGGGNRKCIGDDLATMKAILTIAAIASHWTLHHIPGTPVRPAVRATLGTHDLHMVPRRRAERSIPA
jgi:pentalenene oxygenase